MEFFAVPEADAVVLPGDGEEGVGNRLDRLSCVYVTVSHLAPQAFLRLLPAF